mgnify:CR=1 FL=1
MNTELLLNIFHAALSAVDPHRAVKRALRVENNALYAGGSVYSLDAFDRIFVVGAGKAASPMAAAVEDALGDKIDNGLIIVKYGHAGKLKTIEQVEAAHPIPDEAGVSGTRRLLDVVHRADEKTLVLCLLSGGGSALLVSPLPGITLEDKQKTTDLLLKAGASIGELNAVRKHLSSVKGGKLARAAFPASTVTLILSDVIGNTLDVIASGPMVPDSTTFADVSAVIEKFGLKTALPERVSAFIERGMSGQEQETAKKEESCFKNVRSVIVGDITEALAAARRKAESSGYATDLLTTELQGEARDAARMLAQTALRIQGALKLGERRCLLSGGATTVTVRGTGKGGRNQELALAFAREIAGRKGITLLSAGTDGTDGPTEAAGAVVDGTTAIKAAELGIDPEAYLENNDSHAFFGKLDALTGEKHHLITGPTGTNVMDLQIILIE